MDDQTSTSRIPQLLLMCAVAILVFRYWPVKAYEPVDQRPHDEAGRETTAWAPPELESPEASALYLGAHEPAAPATQPIAVE